MGGVDGWWQKRGEHGEWVNGRRNGGQSVVVVGGGGGGGGGGAFGVGGKIKGLVGV